MVNNSDTKVSYQGNGQTTVFPFSFPFIQRDYIKVAIYDSLTDETKTIDSDYYVDTVANTVIYPGYEPGQEPAEALQPPILPATSTITIYRQTDVDQLTDLGEKYPLKDIENMADKLTEIIQEQAETLWRAVKVPVGDPKTPEEKLTDLQNYVKSAADSAADAATSEASAQRAAEAAAISEANAAESERLAGGYADTASDAASRAEDSAISARAYNAPDYDNETTYQAGDVVTYTDGNSYRALQETTGNEPPNIIYWQQVTDYVGDNFFEVDEYGYIVPMDSPSHSRYWRVDQAGYIVPIEGGDGGYRPDTRQLSAEYLNVTNEGYIKHLRADDISAQEVDADEMTAEVAAFTTLTANAVNAGTITANSASVTEISAGTLTADDVIAKGPVVDVRAFGAKGDGVHDDTAAIQAAVDYAIANKKNLLISGTCYITSPLIINRQVDVSTYSDYFYITSNGGGLKVNSAISLFTTTLPFTNEPVSQLVNFVNVTFKGNNNDCYVLDGGKFLRISFNNCTFNGIRSVNSSIYLQSIYFNNCNMRYLTGPFYECDDTSYDLKVSNCMCEGITGDVWHIGSARGCCFNGNVIEGASTAIKYNAAYGLTIVGNYFEQNTIDIDGSGSNEKRGVALIGNHFYAGVDTYTIKWGQNCKDCVSMGNYHNKYMHDITNTALRDVFIKDYAGVSIFNTEPNPLFESTLAINDGALQNDGYGGAIKGYGVTGDGAYLEIGTIDAGNFTSCAKIRANFFEIKNGLRLSGQTVATTATSGTATLPQNPAGFMEVGINGTTVKIPYYSL